MAGSSIVLGCVTGLCWKAEDSAEVEPMEMTVALGIASASIETTTTTDYARKIRNGEYEEDYSLAIFCCVM